MSYSKLTSVLAPLVLGTGLLTPAALAAPALGQSSTAADNTKTNRGKNGDSAHSADKGAGTSSDLQMSKQIRREVVKDKSLSTYGHNVKILVAGGKVTLKGPVNSDAEKKAIEAHAAQIAGEGNVTNEITVKADSK